MLPPKVGLFGLAQSTWRILSTEPGGLNCTSDFRVWGFLYFCCLAHDAALNFTLYVFDGNINKNFCLNGVLNLGSIDESKCDMQ